MKSSKRRGTQRQRARNKKDGPPPQGAPRTDGPQRVKAPAPGDSARPRSPSPSQSAASGRRSPSPHVRVVSMVEELARGASGVANDKLPAVKKDSPPGVAPKPFFPPAKPPPPPKPPELGRAQLLQRVAVPEKEELRYSRRDSVEDLRKRDTPHPNKDEGYRAPGGHAKKK